MLRIPRDTQGYSRIRKGMETENGLDDAIIEITAENFPNLKILYVEE